MKLYRANISYMDGCLVLWGSNKRDLERDAASVCEKNEGTLMGVHEVDVPTDRAGLIVWLNSNLDTDNG